MKNGAANFTAERVAKLRQNIDFSDIPEIKDFSGGHLRNRKPEKKPVSFKIDLDNLQWLQSEDTKGYQKKMNGVLRWARLNGGTLTQI
ncbi:BrnA antitoxin family protein [Treponema parvum]|uniref:BrnA antitoxin family protein n=1 Tax=Treponema parvum TaxID=138851 RepID=A0A975EZU0_9SPIR|nr:BrnA antitoxin family protein [Treponema parvum]QTQ11454.1 BrnA antitoxin family protein [Treponema parvum]QTQ16604.1 BrnA antitoxin family protein [Treponema parvum]